VIVKALFGEWTLDAETRQLRRGADEVHLSTKAFQLLTLLIDARPRVMSKAELQEALWPGIFVSEANLFTLIFEIRTAIDDDAHQSRFVRTVHGIGYAFSADAVDIDQERAAGALAPSVFSIVWGTDLVRLTQGESVLGRDADLLICLDSPTVSRRHARILIAGLAATLEDLGSKNGTYLNNQRIESRVSLKDGDQIRVGAFLCVFHTARPGLSTQTQEV
jgi:DNA-binding winged helix-turn-helix (wHTH) protein